MHESSLAERSNLHGSSEIGKQLMHIFSPVLLCFGLFIGTAQAQLLYDCQTLQRSATAMESAQLVRDGSDETRLRLSVFTGDQDGVITALHALAGRDDKQASDAKKHALAAAAWTGNLSALHALLDAGVPLNATTELTAGTPIEMAAVCGHLDAIKALVARGGDVNAGSQKGRRDNMPRGALEVAIFGGSQETAIWLLDNGYTVCGTGEETRTAWLLSRPFKRAPWPASLKARLTCQSVSEK